MPTEELAGRKWESPDEDATEYETGDFLYGLVRLIKPRIVLETGSHRGHATKRISEALQANDDIGILYTCDIYETKVDYIKSLRYPQVEAIFEHGHILARELRNVDLAFLDSGAQRVQEARALQMSPGGFVVLHDSLNEMHEEIRNIFPRYIDFPTPRGLTLFKA